MEAKRIVICIALIAALSTAAWAQDPAAATDVAAAPAAADTTQTAAKAFGFSIDLGVDSLPIPGSDPVQNQSYQRFGFKPELNLGMFGIGLDLTFRAKINIVGPDPIEVYLPDWIPNYAGNGKTFFDVYLPKFLYVRYGKKGGPLYGKLGSIDDLTIGNGFIMGNYSNTRFMPEQRIFGLGFALDGSLFKFPYFGIELAAGNLARFAVLGGRVYVRPLAFLTVPVLSGLELGYEQGVDLKPYLYGDLGFQVDPSYANVFGVDARLPILTKGPFTMTAMADVAFQDGDRIGAMTGLAGRIIGVITYNAQVRLLEDGFIPTYFDSNYDLYRAVKHDSLALLPSSGDFAMGWYVNAGASLFEDKAFFSAIMEGPFAAIPDVPSGSVSDYPHLKAVIGTAEGLIGGFSFAAGYEKYLLGISGDFWDDLFSAEDAQIQASIAYKTGPVLISPLTNLRYDPITDSYDVSSSLQTSVKS